MNSDFNQIKRVVVYRIGSLGDTLVVLPAFHLVRRAFPEAHITLLTNIPVAAKAAPMEAVLGRGNFYDDVIRYSVSLRDVRGLRELSRQLIDGNYDCLVYLAIPKGGVFTSIRDYLFFRSCGIRQIIGIPFSKRGLQWQPIPGSELYTSETVRTLECLQALGAVDLRDGKCWDLQLTDAETGAAEMQIGQHAIPQPFLAASVGTKIQPNDWEEPNWKNLFGRLAAEYPGLPLVLLGAGEERERCERLMEIWNGPKANLCGLTSPRVSAAILRGAAVMICHDSGPMHLAAAAGVPCVAIFSARNPPGVWFPRGEQHTILYHRTPCWGCRLTVCVQEKKACILSITVDEVFGPVVKQLARRGISPRNESAQRAGTTAVREGLASGIRSWSPPDSGKAPRGLSRSEHGLKLGSSFSKIGGDARFHPVPMEEARVRILAVMGRAGRVPPSDFRYIIHVENGTHDGNRTIVVDLFSELCRATEQNDLWLLTVGKPVAVKLADLTEEAGIAERVVELHGMSHEDLCALYSAAEFSLLPSFQEGFLSSLIGAQACGCPVIGTGGPPLHEIGDDGVIRLDPSDLWSSLENLLNVLYAGKDGREPMVRRGLANAALHTSGNAVEP